MLGRDRQQDLSEVSDSMWNAKNNDDVKEAREAEKNFTDRMFNNNTDNQSTEQNNDYYTPASQAQRLRDRMNRSSQNIQKNTLRNFWKRPK